MKKNKAISLVLVLLMIIAVAAACGGAKKPEISPELASSDEALYKEGEKYLSKDPEKARLYLRQVIDSFPKSFYAQKAKLAIADTYYNQKDEGNLILAASEYGDFIRQYPYSPSASLAQYRIGLCFYDKALKPGRDQQKTVQAVAEFKKVMNQFPLSEESKLAQEKILECEERLAEHSFTIGLHYYRVGAYKASTDRLSEILTNYPLYKGMDKIYFYLGDSYYLWSLLINSPIKPDQSFPYFTKLITDYPKSSLAEKAQARLKEIELDQTAPKPKQVKK